MMLRGNSAGSTANVSATTTEQERSWANGLSNRMVLDRERGSVTVEFALVLPLIVLLLGFALSVQNLSHQQNVLQDHARQAARLASAGVTATEIVTLMDLSGSKLSVQSKSPWVTVRVETEHQIVGFLNIKLSLDASATALLESEISSWP